MYNVLHICATGRAARRIARVLHANAGRYGAMASEGQMAAYNRILSNSLLGECIHDKHYCQWPDSATAAMHELYGEILAAPELLHPADTSGE